MDGISSLDSGRMNTRWVGGKCNFGLLSLAPGVVDSVSPGCWCGFEMTDMRRAPGRMGSLL